MERVRRWRGASVALAVLLVVVTGSQVVPDLSTLIPSPAAFSLFPEGDEVPRLSPIRVTFSRTPTDRTPESLLQITPAVPGDYAWLSPRTLLFQPAFPGLLRGATYTAVVPARPDAGIDRPMTKKFTVAGKLAVQQMIPGDRDTEVPLDAQVLVQFTRAVAPLTTLSAQPADTVLTFAPPLHGRGEWLNTSIYRFVPTDLAPATTYTVTIPRGLSSAADGVLEQDVRSVFTTIGPAVDTIVPDAGWIYGGPWQEAVVTFNQPMSESAADAVIVTNGATGAVVPGRRTWNERRTVLTFSPTARMANDTKYVVTVPAGLRSARGGTTAKARTSSFTVVGLPSVRQVYPQAGETTANRFGVSLNFGTPMDPESLEGKLSISGFTAKDLEGKVNVNEMGMSASVALAPRTRYTATLAAGALDRYGQAMGAFSWSFTTGSVPSSVALLLPSYAGNATFSASAEPFVWFQTTNAPAVTFTLFPLSADEARGAMHEYRMGDPKWQPASPPIRSWTERVAAGQDETRIGRTSISGGGPLKKGFYALSTDGQYASRFVFAVVDTVIVAKTSFDELLAWVVDHDSGKPLAGVTVHAEGVAGPADAVTNASGIAAFALPKPVFGTSGDRGAWLTSTDGGRLAVVSTRWQGLTPFQFGLPGAYYQSEWVGHVYTDRPIYRPSETVFVKAVVRADDDARYSIPPRDVPLQFVLRNARGQELERRDVRLDEFGAFSSFFDLPADAPLGDYAFFLEQKNPNPNVKGGLYVAGGSFTVAEFRKPEFQVELRTDRASYVSGDTIATDLVATYFFGGAVGGASATWSAVADYAYSFRAKGFETYSFNDYDYYRTAITRDALRAKGAATTDAEGRARFTVPAVLNASEGPQRFTVGASVAEQSGQAVGAGTQVTVHPASLYAGIRAPRYVVTTGQDADLQLATVDTDGAALPGRTVTVRVYDRQWVTTKVQVPGGGRRYQSEPKDVLLETLAARTDANGLAAVTFRVTKAGQLRAVAEVTDEKGRTSRSSTFLYASGSAFAFWQVTNDDTIKLVADRDRYEVGDTAEVLVPAPFAGATALITIERGKIITRETRVLPTNSERLRIPIVDGSVPNVFVSVVLYRAPTAADPLPRYKVGYTQLLVSTTTRQLSVKITPAADVARPGQTVKYAIKVTDAAGKGVRSQLSVAVVDKAVLSLAEERGPDGLRAFWFERGLAVNTTSSMSNSLDRWNDVVAELPKVGKGGSGGGLQGQPRQDFRNTAFWDAQVMTDDKGDAVVNVLMPDDLTTWRLQARAISGDTMVGEGTNELVSTKPLLVRSALPRFLRVGDTVQLRTLVRNATRSDALVTTAIAALGNVTLADARPQTKSIPAGRSVDFAWTARVRGEGDVTVRFAANTPAGSGEPLDDSMELTLQAIADLTPETMSTSGVVTREPGLEAIYLPTFADTAHGRLSVTLRSALVGPLGSELAYYRRLPQEGAEWVASRLIATLGVARLERSTGRTAYQSRIASDLAGLIQRQRPDGGWAWCDEAYCATDPNVTGWVLLALGEARRDGLAVDEGVASRASSYVFGYVNRPNTSVDGAPNDKDQRAFLLAALASSGGRGVFTVANALFEQERASLASWGKAYLINAFAEYTGGEEQIKTLLNDLAARTIPSANGNHWEDATAPSSLSFMDRTAATALVALALVRTQPGHQLLPQTIRWLTVARAANGWSTSIDRAMAILALSSFAVKTGELGAEYSYRVMLDDRELMAGLTKSGVVTDEQKSVPLTAFTPGRVSLLSLTRDALKPGRMYYALDLRYMTPAQGVDSLNRGLAVSHTYTLLDEPDRPIARAKLGDTVRVTLTIMAPHDRSYVTVEDLLPAGLEAIDARLRTTDPALRAQLEKERRASSERGAGGYAAPWLRWYYSPWQQVEMRDDRTVLKAQVLPKGVYEFTYYARATTIGDFFVAPAHAEETYFPEVFGRSDSRRFTVAAP